MDISLRLATQADSPELARVHVAAWRRAYRGIVPEATLQQFTVELSSERFGAFLAEGASETYLAEYEGRAAGFLTLGSCRDSDIDPKSTGEIWGIYVLPELWRKGVGRFLCEQGQRLLASRDFAIATLWVIEANLQARRFYQALGFSADGATKELPFETPVPAIRYRMILS